MTGREDRAQKRLISDTNYYVWRGKGKKIGWAPELFDELWADAARIGPEAVEVVKDEIRQQLRG